MRSRIGALLILVAVAFAVTGYARSQMTAPPPPPPPPSSATAPQGPKRIRIGGNVQQAKLISQVQPVYPDAARRGGIQGDVVLRAIIGVDGSVKGLDIDSGDPLLVQAAIDAVHQWKYQPTLLNGEPVEVDTTVTVKFVLSPDSPQQETHPPKTVYIMPGQTASADTSPKLVDPQLMPDILHLIEVMKVRENLEASMRATIDRLRPQLLTSLPATPNRDKIADAYLNKLFALAVSDEYIKSTADIYAKYLSDADVKALIAFYQTPAGEHYNAASAKIFAETAQAGQENVATHLPGILKDLCSEFPELQGEARFCPKIELGPATGAPPTPAAPGATAAPATPSAPTTPPAAPSAPAAPAPPAMHPPDDGM